jgi:hypothetical protein
MKITIPVAVSIPNGEGHMLQIALTPEGVLGRLDTGVKGRANRIALYADDRGHKTTDLPENEILLMRIGDVEMDADMLRALVERGYATGDEASIVNALKKAWEHAPIRVQDGIKTQEWIGSTTTPSWPVEAAPVVTAPVVQVTEASPVEVIAPVGELPNIVMDADTASSALKVHDNMAAYKVPVAVEEWVPVKFTDTDIDSIEYLERAKNGGWNIAITGSTGCGKSALCYNTAVKWGTAYAAIPFSEATDTTALWDDSLLVPDGMGGTRSMRVLTAAGMVAKYGGVMEWQEINGAADAMLTAIYGVLDFGRQITLSNGSTIPLHKDCIIIATQNPVDAAHSHASHMSTALDRRFWHVEMGYMTEIEEKLVPVKALREIAQEIRRSDIQQPFGTDSLVKVHKAIQDFGLKQGVTGMITMFRDSAAREIVRPIIDVRLTELGTAYNQEVESDVEEADLSW